jgi:hypothetical protein
MKYFRIFLTVLALAVTMSVSAQSKTTSKTKSAPAKTAVRKTTTVKKTSAASTRTATATKKSSTTTKTVKASKQDYDSSVRVMFETKIGSHYGHAGFGENIVLEKKYNPYFAVDFFSIDWSAPFKVNTMTIGVKTGVRGFTPAFWNTSAGKIARGYSSLALGYDCALLGAGSWVAHHGFAFSWGIGLEFVEKANFGYALEYSTAMKTCSHYFRIGVKF